MTDERPLLLGECAKCPLFVDDQYKLLVKGYGVADRLVIVGEAPGAQEVSQHRPFVGESGRLVRAILQKLGIDPNEDVYWTNACLCRPPGNKTPTPTAIKSCNSRLLDVELPMVMPVKILALGGVALSGVLGTPAGLPITKWRGKGMNIGYGSIIDDDGRREFTAYGVASYHPAAVLRDLDLFRDLVDDITKLIENDTVQTEPKIQLVVPTDPIFALNGLKKLFSPSNVPISCDIETTGLNPLADEIMSIGWGVEGDGDRELSCIVDPKIFNDDQRDELAQILNDWEGELVFQNGKFDLQFLDVWAGQPIRPKHFRDTMILHYALDERPIGRYAAHGLKDLARIHYDADDYRFDFKAYWKLMESIDARRSVAAFDGDEVVVSALDIEEQEAKDQLYKYQALDTIYTIRLFYDLMDELEAECPEAQVLLEQTLYPGTLAFTEIELYGAALDLDYLHTKHDEYVWMLKTKLESLQQLAGETFNPSSPIQVQRFLFDTLKLDDSNGRSTERESMNALITKIQYGGTPLYRKTHADHVAMIRQIIEYRLRSKVLATYIDGLLSRVDADGRIRTSINIAGTATGRLSSSDPNLQNIPTLMGPEIRHAFIASPGYTFVEADYSQLELRVAAWYSRDEGMLETFRDNRDIHRAVAAAMFRKDEADVSEHERYLAKYVDFGVIYGRQAKSLAEGWEMDYLEHELGGTRWTIPEAEHFLNEFLNSYPRLRRWMASQAKLGLEQQYVSSPMGRRRRFPFVTRSIASSIGRQAVNTPIQGFASDICLTALIRLHNSLPEGAAILFPVHDSISFEVRDDLLDEILPIIRSNMETNLPCGVDKVLPFTVKIKAGKRWSELVEVPRA